MQAPQKREAPNILVTGVLFCYIRKENGFNVFLQVLQVLVSQRSVNDCQRQLG